MERTSVFDRLGNRPFSMNKYEKDNDEDDSRNVKSNEVELRIKRFKSDLVPFSTSPIADSLPSPRTPPSLDSKRAFKSTVSTKNDNKIKSTVGLVSTQSLKKSPFSSPSSLKSDAFNQKRYLPVVNYKLLKLLMYIFNFFFYNEQKTTELEEKMMKRMKRF